MNTAHELPPVVQAHPRLAQWFDLGTPGRVTVFSGKVELGQGIGSALQQIAADALSLAPSAIDSVAGDTRRVPNEAYTAGSQSVENAWAVLRPLALHLRMLVLDGAARQLGCTAEDLQIDSGRIVHRGAPTGHTLWTLAPGLALHEPLRTLREPPQPPPQHAIGRRNARADLPQKIAGAGFIHDLVFPAMLHARVVADTAGPHDEAVRARRFADVELVTVGEFVAAVSPREEQAVAAAASTALFPALAADAAPHLARFEPVQLTALPAVDRVVAAAADDAPAGAIEHAATFERGFLAHASIGPCCAVAHLDADSGALTVWSHSQGVFALRSQIARVLGGRPPVRSVDVIHAPGAGCYGHNGADDAAMETVLVALARPGRHVRLLWTRPDELQRAPAGPAMRITLRASLHGGRIAAWHARLWSGTHGARPGWQGRINLPAARHACTLRDEPAHDDVPSAAGGGGDRNALPLYRLPALDIVYHHVPGLPVRTSSLRTLGAHANVFAIEGFIDELAALAGTDPLAFRLQHLGDERARAVLQRAAQMARWADGAGTDTRGRGIALARYKNKAAWMACVVEVDIEPDLRVTEVWCAVDCGLAVDPDGVANQVEGGVVQALSWSLHEDLAVTHEGRIAAASWDDYPVLRFDEVPRIHVELMPSGGPPLGVGEVAAGPVAGALGNAVAAVCGVRLRRLPITRERIAKALS